MNKKVLTHTGDKTVTCAHCRNCFELDVTEFDAPYLNYDDKYNENEREIKYGYLVEINTFCPHCHIFIQNGFVKAENVFFEE